MKGLERICHKQSRLQKISEEPKNKHAINHPVKQWGCCSLEQYSLCLLLPTLLGLQWARGPKCKWVDCVSMGQVFGEGAWHSSAYETFESLSAKLTSITRLPGVKNCAHYLGGTENSLFEEMKGCKLCDSLVTIETYCISNVGKIVFYSCNYEIRCYQLCSPVSM